MYKVCGDECIEADMLAGIDAAVGDGLSGSLTGRRWQILMSNRSR
jgi:hypothetical protein